MNKVFVFKIIPAGCHNRCEKMLKVEAKNYIEALHKMVDNYTPIQFKMVNVIDNALRDIIDY
jgi:hypothetical protein